jgi:2-C-methyl-D-erythritol 4-phosphate cytidylyltransferase/2-C-methyl-D-erythritol 2,4-cyclodiphosphate synthase
VDCEAGRKPLAAGSVVGSSSLSDRPSFAAVIVAAGQGLRAGQPVPKQFAPYKGHSVLRVAAEALVNAGADRLVVAIPEGSEAIAGECLAGLPVALVTGGATRQDSVRAALEMLAQSPPELVLIHDAARPDCPTEVVERLLSALAEHPAGIPVLPVVDSIAVAEGELMKGSADRALLRRVQTPQAFRFRDIMGAHRAWSGDANAGDDAQVAQAAGLPIALVEGDERLRKLTFAADFAQQSELSSESELKMSSFPYPRTGTGFDVHRLVAGEELWLCGVRIEHERGLLGHSDADVGLHAVVDAILGACAAGDIGQHFPPSDPQWRGAPSSRFVEHAVTLAAERGFAVGNVDLTLICEAPKIGPHRDAMRQRLAELLKVEIEAVNVKATTTEGLGFTGRGEGIAAQAVATLVPVERSPS